MATAVGLPGVIAHGMLTMALGATAITDWTGDPASVVEYGVRFTSPSSCPTTTRAPRCDSPAGGVREADGTVRVDLTARPVATRCWRGQGRVRPPRA